VTISAGGTTCATLKLGKGTHTDGATGTSIDFTLSEIDISMANSVSVNTYADGTIGIQCGTGSAVEIFASAGELDTCGAAVFTHEVVRAADISSMQVNLRDALGTPSTLFACN
jgi:hypothetical protein